jgi:acyl carrier protein
MKLNTEDVKTLIINTLSDLVDTLPDDQKFVPDYDTKLFGPGSLIDSLNLVSFIVDLEGILSSDYDLDIVLTDDRAMTREVSPFDNVSNLVEYVTELVEEQNTAS